jgi:hypothetical protein
MATSPISPAPDFPRQKSASKQFAQAMAALKKSGNSNLRPHQLRKAGFRMSRPRTWSTKAFNQVSLSELTSRRKKQGTYAGHVGAKSTHPARRRGTYRAADKPVFAQPRSDPWRLPPIGVRQRHRSAPADASAPCGWAKFNPSPGTKIGESARCCADGQRSTYCVAQRTGQGTASYPSAR